MIQQRFLANDIDTESLGFELAQATPPGGTWLLYGSLGSGKTTWARGFVAGLGGSPDQVTSPTYSVLHRYISPSGNIWHLDLYRLGETGAWTIGLEDQLVPDDRVIVEWPGRSGPWASDWIANLHFDSCMNGRMARIEMP